MSESTVTKRKPVGKDISTRRRVAKARRHFRLRKKVNGTAERPRLAVHRSSKHITVQIIDDLKGHTIAAASSMEADVRALDGDKKARAAKVGQLAEDLASQDAQAFLAHSQFLTQKFGSRELSGAALLDLPSAKETRP